MSKVDHSVDGQYRIDIEKLGVLNHLGVVGAGGVEARLGKLAGKPTAVESGGVKNGYVDESTVDLVFPAERRLGVRMPLDGVPRGCVLVLFTPPGASRAIRLMLADTDEDVDQVSNEMAVSTLVELGGIIANGFLDALADTFDQHIATQPPVVLNDQLSTVVGKVVAGDEGQGLYLESALNIASHDIDVTVYLFPENDIFAQILDRIDMGMLLGEVD
ncbi:chemotaxis protein CheC [Salinigranum salinum]|uniref:chemotaxis protein CheC n=1 Tax=Salinigranum salinum TaxID=1364937 RepID=UPI0012611EFA|nr:chemotaxis protein CheC [Salinigranum salinum]